MPTQFVPHNRFAHAPRSVGGMNYPSSKAMVTSSYTAPVIAAPAFATFQHNEKAITFHNISNPNLLRVEAPAMERGASALQMKLFKNNARNGEYRLEYTPQGDTHRVTASYGGHALRDFPIMLAPKAPQVQVTNPGSEMKIYGVHKPRELGVHTTMPYSATIDKSNTVTLNYAPRGTENLQIDYKGQAVPGGQITLAPHPDRLRAQAYSQLPLGYGYAPQGGYMMQPGMQQMMVPAVPAHMVAGAPMQAPMVQAAPTLMAPRAAAGYQPMRATQVPYQRQLQAQGPPVRPGYSQVML